MCRNNWAEEKNITPDQTQHNTNNSWSAFDQSRESTKKSNQLDCLFQFSMWDISDVFIVQ